MSKASLDTDIYGDIYGDEVDLQDAGEDTQIDGVQDEDFETVSAPVSPVEETSNKTLPAMNADNTHALPPKPASSQHSLSYSAQVAQQFSAYQQTPSQERQQRQAIPSLGNTGVNGAVKHDENADTVYGKKPSEMHDHGKLFIGGLSWDTTDEGLRNYFQQFGKVDACTIMRDPNGTSRGFAFLTFEDENSVKGVLGKEHLLDGKAIDPKRAIPREEHLRNTRFFVGGLSPNTTPETMKEFFGTFGKVVDATVMMDRDTGRSKGFGFVTYEDATNADQLVGKIGLILDDKQASAFSWVTDLLLMLVQIEVKTAQPRSQRDQARNSSTSTPGRDNAQNDQMSKIAPSNIMAQQPSQNQVPMMFNRGMGQLPMMGGGNVNMMNMNPMAMMGMGMGIGGFNPMAMNGMNMMNPAMQGMGNMQGMNNMANNMANMGGMPGMGNMGAMRMGMGPMGMGMNGGMGVGAMGGNPNLGAVMNSMGMNMRPNIASMGGGMGRMGTAAAGPGPARMSSRGQHNFHPYSR